MANLKGLKAAEHQVEDRQRRSPAGLKPLVPTALTTPQQPQQQQQLRRLLVPRPQADDLFVNSQNVQIKLTLASPALNLKQQQAGRNLNLELLTLDKVLYDAKKEESIEEGMLAIPPKYADLTAGSTPSLGRLQAALQGLDEEDIPTELEQAVRDLTAKIVEITEMESSPTPAHPKPGNHKQPGLEAQPGEE